VKAVQEPAPPVGGGGVLVGGDTGQSCAGNGHSHVVQLLRWWERWRGAAGMRRLAPCWALREQPWAGRVEVGVSVVVSPGGGAGAGGCCFSQA
jgi:hypothetical protein